MTVINIAGTSGSGKTMAVRGLLALSNVPPLVIPSDDRWRQHGLVAPIPTVDKPVFVVGRYEDWDTGGCDTIKDVELVYTIIQQRHKLGCHVVFEGLFVMNHTRGMELARALREQFVVMHLRTDLQTCKASVNERRARRGQEPITGERWHNTEGNFVRARNYADKCRNAGAVLHRLQRDEVLPRIMEVLRG